jgi:hypothetical protein
VSRYLGLDPGLTGALAVVAPDGDGVTVTVTPTPTVWVTIGTKELRRRRYDVDAMLAALRSLPPITLAYLERQSARPGQGVSSMFTTGYGFGLWEALLTASAIPFAVIAPQAWRRRVGLAVGGDKAAVRLAALARFPGLALRVDHADALMLAVAASLEGDATHSAPGDRL